MTGKRQKPQNPHRLTDFFVPAGGRARQDGAEAYSSQRTSCGARTSPRASPQGTGSAQGASDGASSSPPPTPSSCSPAKSRPRLDGGGLGRATSPTASQASDSGEDTRELPESIISFPTQNQPVMDTVLKDMLISLRSTLQSDMATYMHRLTGDVREVGNRVNHIESKMEEYATTINELVDANEDREADNEWIKAKLADMEDRSRRNNLKIRGIPESVQQHDLNHYVTSMFKDMLPDLSDLNVTIDRIHRLPKPSHLSEQVPRDVLLRLHFFHVKDKLMVNMRKREQIPEQYQNIQFYADLSQYTLQKRKNLTSVTKILRNHKIIYRWGYPTKLSVTKDNRTYIITSLEKGLDLLRDWGLLPADHEQQALTSTPHHVEPGWKQVTSRNAKTHA